MILDNWTKDQSVGDADWTTVFSTDLMLTNIYGFIFHVSTEKMLFRFEAPGVGWEADLEEIAKDYMLDTTSAKQVPKWLYSTGMGRYVLEFVEPLELQGTLTVKLKSKSGNKTLYRGFLSRGLR